MSQFDFGNLSPPLTGADFINNYLETWRDALHTSHSGVARPSYVQTGMVWLDTNASPWAWKLFDGSNDIVISYFNATTHALSYPAFSNPVINGFTGDTTVVNIGSGQIYKAADGKVGIGTASPAQVLHVNGRSCFSSQAIFGATTSYNDGSMGTPSIQLYGTLGVRIGCVSIVDTTSYIMHIAFRNTPSGANVGSISTTGNVTSYNVSSDYRLKEDVQPMVGALEKIALLKPCTFKWRDSKDPGEGFIAHELQEICPHAVSGKKDGTNKDGSPAYQGVDTSHLVGLLTAAIQELHAKVTALEQQIIELS